MRLLNIETMRVESLPTREITEIPEYAILSHRWGAVEDEVVFDEMQNRSEKAQRKKGYQKIQKCCEIASSTGFEYIWIDTCCINKEKQYELDSTLASMFKDYREAQVCYAYLPDVSADDNPFDEGSEFRRSSWFRRGWTLQELVAPLSVIFFDRDWNEIGTKSNLKAVINEITDIPHKVLSMNESRNISLAERRAWANGRDTLKIEDKAYSLMGLLGIKIPVKYGEGEEALRKIDAEIERLKGIESRDPSNFNVASWTRGEREYRFLLPIQHPPPQDIHIERRDLEDPAWDIGQDEIKLQFKGSGNCATIIFKNASGLVFAICLGVHNYHVWCGMTNDCKDEDIEKVSKSYWDGDKQWDRWDNLDRKGLKLPNGRTARLAIKKGRKNEKSVFFAEVSAEGFWPHKAGPGVYPGWWTG
ncbi:heterokaryon incompatibility protein-domain-containing protein [Annulohypoxylon moriforme]|nr:heterokaryon incompatibility protein-domain-containing protein [Annulohypoxylon moriforme]